MVSDDCLLLNREEPSCPLAYIMCYSTVYKHTFTEGYTFTAGFSLGQPLLPYPYESRGC